MMALFTLDQCPKELHGFPLSDRTRWLLYAPLPLLMPRHYDYIVPFLRPSIELDWLKDIQQVIHRSFYVSSP